MFTKRIVHLAVAFLFILVLLLTACSNGVEPPHLSEPTAAVTPEPSAPSSELNQPPEATESTMRIELPTPEPVYEGELYLVGSKGSYGFMDENNTIIISEQYKDAHGFVNGYCAVSNGSAWGFIDKANRLVIPFEYQDCVDFSEGLFPVRKLNYWGCVDEDNKTVVDFMYNTGIKDGWGSTGMGRMFEYGRMPVGLNGISGVIDTQGNYIIPLKADGSIGTIELITDSFIICRLPKAYRSATEVFALYDRNGILIDVLSDVYGYTAGALFAAVRHEDRSLEQLIFLSDGQSIPLPNGMRYNRKTSEIVHYYKWVPISTEDARQAEYNFISKTGSLLFDEWEIGSYAEFYQTPHGYTVFSLYSRETEKSRLRVFAPDDSIVFDKTIEHANRQSEYFTGFNGIVVASGNKKMIVSLNTGETTSYPNIEISGPHTAIVSDSLFYGLVVDNMLQYDGIVFTRIAYNSYNDTYTLEKGAESITIRVAISGKIVNP